MKKETLRTHIIRVIRRLTVVVAATLIILTYIYLLNYLRAIFGAGHGWGNPLLWFISALVALVVVFFACWVLTKVFQWFTSTFRSR